MQNAKLNESQAGIKVARRNNFSYAYNITLMAESKEKLEFFDESEWRNWKYGLKLNIQKTKIMASGSITSRQIDGEKIETVIDSSFLGLKITAGEGNGNPLQHSCLENPKDRGAWWATVHKVGKSWTRLTKQQQRILLWLCF